MAVAAGFILAVCFMSFVDPGIGFAPSIDLPTTTPEPTSTTPDPATLPFFPDARDNTSLTVTAGRAAVLPCRVLRLGDRMVSWVKKEGDKLRLITFGTNTYVNNKRYSLFHDNPDSWELVISPVLEEDSGVYACQVSIHPPMQFAINLYVTVPILSILDDRNTAIHEKFYEVGSSVVLQCRGTYLPAETLPLWSKSDSSNNFMELGDDITGTNSSWSEGDGMESDPVVWLKISSASKSDSGNYSCSAPDTNSAFVRVHVVEGEDSVAMQHSTNDASVSRGTPSLLSLIAVLYIMLLLVGIGLPFNVLHIPSSNHSSDTKNKLQFHKKPVLCPEFVKKLFRKKMDFILVESGKNSQASHNVPLSLALSSVLTASFEKCFLKLSKDFGFVIWSSLKKLNACSKIKNLRTYDAQVSFFRYYTNSVVDTKSFQNSTGEGMNSDEADKISFDFPCSFGAVFFTFTTMKTLFNSYVGWPSAHHGDYINSTLLTTFSSSAVNSGTYLLME
ncbi:Immunoglobulin V-set domain [Trinorchestia longiramus]|nr:Immunoglobulin V-set domain [Trinorchestia longiramus]